MSKMIRISEALYELIEENRGNRIQGQYVEEIVRRSLSGTREEQNAIKVDEILELVQSQPSTKDIQSMFDEFIQAAREVKEERRATNPAAVTGVQTGYAGLTKNADCRHCGKKFAGNRFAQVCPECEELGHKRVPTVECPECTAGVAL